MDEAVRSAVNIGVVDLGWISNHDDFGSLRHAGDDCLCLERGELLGLVQDEEAIRDGAAADVAEGLDLEESSLDELLVGLERGSLCAPSILRLLDGLFLLLLPLGGVGSTRPFVPLRMDGKEHLEGVVD